MQKIENQRGKIRQKQIDWGCQYLQRETTTILVRSTHMYIRASQETCIKKKLRFDLNRDLFFISSSIHTEMRMCDDAHTAPLQSLPTQGYLESRLIRGQDYSGCEAKTFSSVPKKPVKKWQH